ncbi:hypothetical protein E4U56_003344 [Claviceps arundinis]|uniref:2EXR domain-containing protein n=1 Tax=Claviceps arundinis TaxID=1623583 RepID=A0A9P7MZU0_9HYPO|nr:hypothetical protein E4U56_003344 [Claviceps arundinis]
MAEKPGEEFSRSRNGDTAPGAFPQFMQLPPELRRQIWQFYCSDLSVKARVLPFLEFPSLKVMDYKNTYSLPDRGALAEQTRTLRTVLSTHHESRSIAVRKYPDELFMETAAGASIIRFRKETDVIFVSELATEKDYSILDFGSEVENLAVGVVDDYSEERYFQDDTLLQVVPGIKNLFPNLKRLFSRRPAPAKHKDMEEWCLTEHVHSYMMESHYKTTLFYWPDLDSHVDFARSSVPKLCSLEEMEEAGVELWPMVEFESWKPMKIPDGPEFEDDSDSTGIYSYDDSTADDIELDDDSNADGIDSEDDSIADGTDSDDDSIANGTDSDDDRIADSTGSHDDSIANGTDSDDDRIADSTGSHDDRIADGTDSDDDRIADSTGSHDDSIANGTDSDDDRNADSTGSHDDRIADSTSSHDDNDADVTDSHDDSTDGTDSHDDSNAEGIDSDDDSSADGIDSDDDSSADSSDSDDY